MSLDWSVERMKNYDVLTTLVVNNTTKQDWQARQDGELTRKWLPLTEALIWSTMHVGINSITEKNWQEFYYRIHMWERTLSPNLTAWGAGKGYKRFITPLEVYMHIGLSSNASSLSRKEFVEKVFTILERENKAELEKVPASYIGNELEHISEADYQKLWKQEGTYTLDEKLKGCPLETDENIGSC